MKKYLLFIVMVLCLGACGVEQEVNILNQGGESLAIQMGETDLG
ncbi:MAG: hypothetical protein ACLRQX_07350 [Turicibacter sanguinis]